MHLLTPDVPSTIFSELKIGEVQRAFQVNSNSTPLSALKLTTVGTDSSALIENNLFKASSGTDSGGIGEILSRRHLDRAPGESSGCRMSARFVQGVVGNEQFAGLSSPENRIGFGFIDDVFGVIYDRNGRTDKVTMTVTSGQGGAGLAVITINGIVNNLFIPASLSAEEVASFVATSLAALDPLHIYCSEQDRVFISATTPGVGLGLGAYSYAALGTSAATFAQAEVGQAAVELFVPKSTWNLDILPFFDPLTGNLFEITFQTMGWGDLSFSVVHDGRFVEVHRINFVNENTTLNMTETNLSATWSSRNINGGTTDIEVLGQAAMGYGGSIILPPLLTYGANSNVSNTQSTAEEVVLALKNPEIFNGKLNRVDMKPLIAHFNSTVTQKAIYVIYLNAVTVEPIIWQPSDNTTPIQFSRQTLTVVSGQLVHTAIGRRDDSPTIDMRDTIVLTPGDNLMITTRITGANGSNRVQAASINWSVNL